METNDLNQCPPKTEAKLRNVSFDRFVAAGLALTIEHMHFRSKGLFVSPRRIRIDRFTKRFASSGGRISKREIARLVLNVLDLRYAGPGKQRVELFMAVHGCSLGFSLEKPKTYKECSDSKNHIQHAFEKSEAHFSCLQLLYELQRKC